MPPAQLDTQQKFSWLQALAAVRASLASDLDAGVMMLHDLLKRHPLQGFEIELVGRLLGSLNTREISALPLFRPAVLATDTSEPLANALRVALLCEGYVAEVYEAPYGAYRQELLAPSSGLIRFAPDAVLLALTGSSAATLPAEPLDAAEVDKSLDADVEAMRALWDILSERVGKPVMQHLCVTPEEDLLGVADRRAFWSAARYIDALNERFLNGSPAFIKWIDVDRLASRVGRENWRDPRLYHHGKFGFASKFLPEYTALLRGSLRQLLGKAKKALILDLDNTLWGGVIGDDRLEGIRLGPDTAEGNAYSAFASYIKQLGQRGVILGICSKNDLKIAMEVFEKHAHMPLRVSDFAAIACSWEDKATNLRGLAEELNIDLSSIVMVDDNPAECELIRQRLPEVETVLMNDDPSSFVRKLDRLHLFDADTLSKEDLQRTESYKARAKSKQLHAEFDDIGSYLTSLEMRAAVVPAGPVELQRLAQMEMKTNQFNLATRRLSFEQLSAMAAAANSVVLAVSLIDRFADHGIVSYVAATHDGEIVRITDWVMSCRVFSRTLEHLVFNQVARFARDCGARTIEATLVPTQKNAVMNGLFETLGFEWCEGTSPQGTWRFSVSPDKPLPRSFVDLNRPAFQPVAES